jgi:glutamate-1-semialdehyde 2,1-aminomutase
MAILVAGAGGHFQPYFTAALPRDYREALTVDTAGYRRFVAAAHERRAVIAQNPLGHCALSIAHTEANLTVLIEAIGGALSSAPASATA